MVKNGVINDYDLSNSLFGFFRNYDDLLDFYGLTEKNIINAVEDILKR